MMKKISIKDTLRVDADKVRPGHILHNGVVLSVYKQEGGRKQKTIFWLETADASSWVEDGQQVPVLGLVTQDLLEAIKSSITSTTSQAVRFREYDKEGKA